MEQYLFQVIFIQVFYQIIFLMTSLLFGWSENTIEINQLISQSMITLNFQFLSRFNIGWEHSILDRSKYIMDRLPNWIRIQRNYHQVYVFTILGLLMIYITFMCSLFNSSSRIEQLNITVKTLKNTIYETALQLENILLQLLFQFVIYKEIFSCTIKKKKNQQNYQSVMCRKRKNQQYSLRKLTNLSLFSNYYDAHSIYKRFNYNQVIQKYHTILITNIMKSNQRLNTFEIYLFSLYQMNSIDIIQNFNRKYIQKKYDQQSSSIFKPKIKKQQYSLN